MKRRTRNRRRGNTLVLTLLFMIPLMAFLALSIDIGLLAMARTQCQDASDLAALAGVRTLNGTTANGGNNYSAVTPAAQQAATNNKVLWTQLQPAEVAINIGRYVYNLNSQQFEGQFPGPSTDNWSLVQATTTVNVSSGLVFSKVLGIGVPTLQTTATAVHRPRDIAIILDFSGSMRFGTFPAYAGEGNQFCALPNVVNNEDTEVPSFGHYSAFGSGSMYATSYTSPFLPANITATTSDGRPPLCADFYQDANGTPAFTPAPASYATTPGGDNFLTTVKNTTSTYAQTVAEVLNISPGNVKTNTYDTTFETSGYTAYGMAGTFHGYTQGPGYYGKTFFVWPPDPRAAHDWRKLYFTYPGSATPMNDNSLLWDPSGNWQAAGSSTYNINYDAILHFIQNVGPNPFPSTMRSGRIVYYTSIPTTIDTSTWPPTDLNQRFWKDYIDYVLGMAGTGVGQYSIINNAQNSSTGYGGDVTWGTITITPKAQLKGGAKTPYMFYNDNPTRPLLNFWFGPLTMIDFLDNYKLFPGNSWVSNNRYCWWPGTCHEAPMYACKLGIQAALNDLQNNHPNDWASLIMFSIPKGSSGDTTGRFNNARVGMGQNYSSMLDSLWYPPATVGNSGATVTPYDSDNLEVPRAYGGTCYQMALMLAYNQFSAASACSNYAAPTGIAGGNGRKGAQKIVIFETDGAPNTTASAQIVNNGAYQSYYPVRYNPSSPNSSEYPTGISGGGWSDNNNSTVINQINSLCQQICNLDTASPPGYSTTTRQALIHCISFGPLVDSTTLQTLNNMQTIGNVNDGMPSYKIINGTQSQNVSNLQQAFTNILESTVPVSLIQ